MNLRPSFITFISGSVYFQPDDESQYSSSTGNPLPTISDSSSDGDEYRDENQEQQDEQEAFDTYYENLYRDLRSPLPIIPEESSPEASPPASADRRSERRDVVILGSRAASQSAPSILQAGSSKSVFEKKTPSPGSVAERSNTPMELGEETKLEEDQDTGLASKSSHSRSSPTPKFCNDVKKGEDCSFPQTPGKRSATDAFPTDSPESQPETKIPRTPTRKTSFSIPSIKSDVHEGPMKTQADILNNEDTKGPQGEHSRSPSVTSEQATSTGELESRAQPAEPQLENADPVAHPQQPPETNKLNPQDEDNESALQENQGSSNLTSTSVSENSSLEVLTTNDTEEELEVEETLNTQSKVASDDLIMFGSDDDEKSAEMDEYFSPIPVKGSGFVTPSTTTSAAVTTAQEASEVSNTGMERNVEKSLESSEVTCDDLSALYDGGTPTEVDEDSPSPTPVKPTPTSTPNGTTSKEYTVANDTETTPNAEKILETPKSTTNDLPDTEPGTPADEDSDDPGSPTLVISRIIRPSTSSELGDTENPSIPHSTSAFPDVHEASEHVANEPMLSQIDGFLVIVNPPYASSETYKVAITVSVKLQKGKLKGWNDLVVPGLPKLRPEESGYFIFQMSENRGMEFRTTSFHSHEFISTFFVAGFSNSNDLVVPLRACNLGYYGIVKDFAVAQEIRSDYAIQNVQGMIDLTVTYNIVCSLKLPNHCFWAKTCSVFLYLEGGPDCNYRHVVYPSEERPPVIYLRPGVKRIGATRIQIICAPKDLEMFSVVWKAKYSGKKISNWLPRIYPDSASAYRGERPYSRWIFTESQADTTSCCQSCSFASVAMFFVCFLLLVGLLSQSRLRNNYPDSSMVLPGVKCLENPVEINQTNEVKASKAYEVMDIAGENNVEPESPPVKDQSEDMETKDEKRPELGTKSNSTAESQTLSWRDRVDYFLGWNGPLRQQVQ